MLIQGQVGPIALNQSISAGMQAPVRQGNLGDIIASELHGRYYETTYRRSQLQAANQVPTGTSAALNLAYTGLILSNPIGSSVNLVLNKVGYSFGVAFPAAAAIGLMTGFNASTNVSHTTSTSTRSSFIGLGAVGQGLVDVSATMPTAPTVHTLFDVGLTGAITVAPGGVSKIIDMEGSIILPPGAYVAIYTSTASGASSFMGSFAWEEVPS